jgi:sugar phosphate isomerase/epimerase
VRELAQDDFFGVIRSVAEAGYDGVEFAGYYEAAPAEIRHLVDELALDVVGAHKVVPALESALDEVIAYCQAIRCSTLICPGFWGVDYGKVETFQKMADLFNRVGDRCQREGMRFMYHVHGHEFVQLGDRTGMDVLLEETDPQLVLLEPDVYWIEKAGHDARAFVAQHRARSPYIHLKDAVDRENWHDTEIGDGVVDIAGIVADAAEAEWLIIEQEAFSRPLLESIRISHNNVRGMMSS